MDGQQAFELLRDWAPLFIALLAPNVIQSLGYLRIRRMWSALPVVHFPSELASRRRRIRR